MEGNKYAKSVVIDLKSLFVPYVYEAYCPVNLIEEMGLEDKSPQKIEEACYEMVVQALVNSLGEEVYQNDVVVEKFNDSLGEYLIRLTEQAISELHIASEDCYLPSVRKRLEYVIWLYRD